MFVFGNLGLESLRGRSKNDVTDKLREEGFQNGQILVTNSDNGGREVFRIGDILN